MPTPSTLGPNMQPWLDLRRSMRVHLRRVFPDSTLLGQVVRTAAKRLRPKRLDPPQLQDRLWAFAAENRSVVFVQIGSHDGITGDPISDILTKYPGWTGILVEPIPELFQRLKNHRGGSDRFKLVEAAVASESGWVEMTTLVLSPDMPVWADQLSTLRPQVMQRHRHAIPSLEQRRKTVPVRAVTFAELVADLDRIDFIHLDTEGSDAEILKQIDLQRWRPSIILYEHKHLSSWEKFETRRRLSSAGYCLVNTHSDTLATLSECPGGRLPE